MPMDLNQQKEQFSNAYFCAVVAAAGYSFYKPNVDDGSIDWGIKGYREPDLNYIPQLELQLKCTANEEYLSKPKISFDLGRKNYNDLANDTSLIPRILIVVIVPDNLAKWSEHTESHLILRYCAYWLSLKGQASIEGAKKRVYLDRTNVFSVKTLKEIMTYIGVNGEL
ncbi:MAG: DUF4365 domain-containing protein [Anaerolineae bacterium]|jgi:hypothetical protein|nr:DUF4365 domain-containing protein [Anaerolineae bacterium]